MEPSDAASPKRELRTLMTRRLRQMDPGERAQRSQAAAEMLFTRQSWRAADRVLVFLSMPAEIDTAPILAAARSAGKALAVPRIDKPATGGPGDIHFVLLPDDWSRWPRDSWNIPGPPADALILECDWISAGPAIIIVPGLAFDRKGGRLGRGKGYYDRFLTTCFHRDRSRCTAIGLGFAFQELEEVPMETWDYRLDDIVLA